MPSETCPSSSLRHRLRTSTAEAHARLDRDASGYDLQRLAGYRRFLEISAAALLPLEAALVDAGVARIFPDWPARSRRHAILDDLADLDGEFDPLPPPGPLDLGGVLGTMYVLEGSRLGARLLLNTVEESADPEIVVATAYLRHGAGQGLWPSFLAALEDHAASLRDYSSAVSAAVRAFELFERAAARRPREKVLA